MTEETPNVREAALPEDVREHLGRALRSRYAAGTERPQYLGDPALPEAFTEPVRRLEGRLKAHEEGTEAVRDALAAILDGAPRR
jgi:hypothetical protein